VALIKVEPHLALLRIQRPEVRNAFDNRTLVEMRNAIRTALSEGVAVIALAGDAGTFCAGSDLKAYAAGDDEYRAEHTRLAQDVMNDLEAAGALTLALVEGFCLGGGLELALACDLRIAVQSSTWGFPEVTLGVIPSGGGTQRIGRYVGLGRAKQLILLGERIDAAEACRLGLANWMAADFEGALNRAQGLAHRVHGFTGAAVPVLKELVTQSFDLSLEDGLTRERDAEAALTAVAPNTLEFDS